jgi:hypothetical protein
MKNAVLAGIAVVVATLIFIYYHYGFMWFIEKRK